MNVIVVVGLLLMYAMGLFLGYLWGYGDGARSDGMLRLARAYHHLENGTDMGDVLAALRAISPELRRLVEEKKHDRP